MEKRRRKNLRNSSAQMLESLEARYLLANSIGLEFGAQEVLPGNSGLDSTHVAGVVQQANWNNLRNGSGAEPSQAGIPAIVDATGTNTGVAVSWTAQGTWRMSNTVPAAGDEEMMNSAVFQHFTGNTQAKIPVTVSNIPYAYYDVYVYVPGDNTNDFIDISANGRTVYGVSTNNTAATDGNAATAYPYQEITGTSKGTRTGGNYAVIHGVSGATLNLLVAGGDNAPIFNGPYNTTLSGIQIVESGPTAISLEFASQEVAPAGNGLASGTVAGVFPAARWNNLRNATGSEPGGGSGIGGAIVDSGGTASGATVAWSGQGTWKINNAITPAGGDEQVGVSAVYEQAGPNDTQGSIPVTITNVPYAKYDVYVYFPGDNNSNYIDISANGQTLYGVWQNNVNDFDGNAATAFPWTQVTGTDVDTTHANGRNNGNYAVFKGLTGSQLDILVKGGANPPVFNGPYNTTLSGIQIVDATVAVNGSIGGVVFKDKNANGVNTPPDDVPIAGWTVYLDTNNNNVLDPTETSTTTNASGAYSFGALPDGTYHVKQVFQSGLRKTLPGPGIQGYDVVIAGGNTVTGKDFGMTTNILLGGLVFNDSNGNGTQDAGEAPIAGAKIDIKSGNVIIASRTTGADGRWKVIGLAAGSGEADVTPPAGFVATSPVGGKYVGSMSSGEQNNNLNFGLHTAPPAPAPTLFASSSILGGVDSDSLIDGLL